jgi:hypothetical protein
MSERFWRLAIAFLVGAGLTTLVLGLVQTCAWLVGN